MKKIILILSLIFIPLTSNSSVLDPFLAGITGCTDIQKSKVYEAEKLLRDRLEALGVEWKEVDLQGVKRDFIDPQNRVWVENSSRNLTYQVYWQKLGRVFNLMREKARSGINFQCQSAWDGQCKKGALAYVMQIFGRPREMIYLCPDFFKDGIATTTLFHELSHYAALTEDYSLDWSNLENSNLERGSRDAYNIERYMNGDVKTILKRDIWLWWWPKQK